LQKNEHFELCFAKSARTGQIFRTGLVYRRFSSQENISAFLHNRFGDAFENFSCDDWFRMYSYQGGSGP